MALVLRDRVRETTTTTGTGALTLAGAASGFQTFSSGIGNANTTYYSISSSTSTDWEVGLGTVSAGALSRDVVIASSNAGSLVNLSAGTKDVFCTYPAPKSVYLDGSGNASIAGSMTATSFSGAGTGLTGTAAGLSIGGTATTATTANALNTANNYQVNSFGVGTAGSGTAGEIRATNNVTAYYSSDIRLKENVREVEDALEKVCAIGSKEFDWTDDYIQQHGGEDGYFVQKSDFGVIAQDVQAVFPQAVRTRTDGTLAVDYEKLATLSFGAIKQLLERIERIEVTMPRHIGG